MLLVAKVLISFVSRRSWTRSRVWSACNRIEKNTGGSVQRRWMQKFKKLESIKELNGLSALDELLIPMDQAIVELPQVFLEHDNAKQIKHGQFISLDKLPESGLVRLYERILLV